MTEREGNGLSSANKSKKRYRFNIVDIILLCVIFISIGAMIFLFFYDGKDNSADNGVKTVEITYTVKQTQVPNILRGKINNFDSVYDGEDMKSLGQVIRVNTPDSKYSVYDRESGQQVEEIYPGKIDIVIDITAEATVLADGRYSVNGKIINVGETMELRFPFYTCNAVCVAVSGGNGK